MRIRSLPDNVECFVKFQYRRRDQRQVCLLFGFRIRFLIFPSEKFNESKL